MTDILSPAPQTEATGAESSGVDYPGAASQAYRAILSIVETVEPRIAGAIRSELTDQRGSLKLIASENYASPAVSDIASTPAARTSTLLKPLPPSMRANSSVLSMPTRSRIPASTRTWWLSGPSSPIGSSCRSWLRKA